MPQKSRHKISTISKSSFHPLKILTLLIMFLRSCLWVSASFFFTENNIPFCGQTMFFYISICQLMDIQIVSHFWFLWTMLLWVHVWVLGGHILAVLIIYVWVKLLRYMVAQCSTIWETVFWDTLQRPCENIRGDVNDYDLLLYTG